MKKHALLAALALASGSAFAAPSEGDIEVVFSTAGGELALVDGETLFDVQARIGYFMTRNHELGGAARLGFNSAADPSESLDLGGFYRYNLIKSGTERDWWYGGVELDLWNVTSDDDQPMTLRPHLGQKYMLSDDVAFDWNIGYQMDLSDVELEDVVNVQFGLSIFF